MAPLYYSVWKSNFTARSESSRCPPRHRLDACSMAYAQRRLIPHGYYFTMAVGAAVSCPWFGPPPTSGRRGGVLPLPAGSAMGPAWYHSASLTSLLQPHKVVHPLGAVVCVLRRGLSASPAGGVAVVWNRNRDAPSAGPADPRRARRRIPQMLLPQASVRSPYPSQSLGEFGRRLVAPGLLAAFLLVLAPSRPRMAQFALGMVIRQGCLSVELTAAERKKVGRGAGRHLSFSWSLGLTGLTVRRAMKF